MATGNESSDEEIFAPTSQSRKSQKRILSSSSDEESEGNNQKEVERNVKVDNDEEITHMRPWGNKSSKHVMRRKNVYTLESSDDNGDTNDIKNQKQQRRKKLEEMARKKNPKFSYANNCKYSQCGNYDRSDTDEEDTKEEDEEEPPYLIEKTRYFKARFTKMCDLPSCSEKYIKDVTDIVGVRIFDPSISDYIGKFRNGGENNYWVCASHSKYYLAKNKNGDNEDITDDKSASDCDSNNEDTEDFIDDNGEADSNTNKSAEYKYILNDLSRSTQRDKENKDNYMKEHARHQLEIHSATNPGLYLSPQKRFERNRNTAKFDKGLKDDRGIEAQDPEYQNTEDIFVFGEKVKIFPRSKRISYYSQQCGLTKCQKIFQENETEVIEAMVRSGGRIRLNSRQKSFFICYSHVTDFRNQNPTDSDSDQSLYD